MAARRRLLAWGACAALALPAGLALAQSPPPVTLLNVSYDPTREFYADINRAFIPHWKQRTGQDVSIRQSHGGSGKQARAVIDGNPADVVTLALAGDIDALHQHGGLVPRDWHKRLPHNSAPYTSAIVLVVRAGNPKGIRDWNDLARPGIGVITPHPKTSGGARWNYLAAWEYGRRQFGGEAQARDFVARLYRNVLVLDAGARGASVSFAQRQQGDVLVAWENEAHLLEKEFGDRVDIVYPSLSIRAEPPVALVDRNVDRHGTRAVAQAYLEYLYSDTGQEIAARHMFRPVNERILAKHAAKLPKMQLFTLEQAFGSWERVNREHFADGGVFDRVYTAR